MPGWRIRIKPYQVFNHGYWLKEILRVFWVNIAIENNLDGIFGI